MNASTDPLDLLSNALCPNERQSALLEVIAEKMQFAINEMASGDARDRELFRCWMLLTTAEERHAALDRQFHDVEEGILASGYAKAIREQARKAVAA